MTRKWICFAAAAPLLASLLLAQRTLQDKNNQSLDIPQDPPLVATGETSHLTFQVSPLSGKGLLSEQTRDALKAILKLNQGRPIIHIRAFSAGNGDVRRIPQIVAGVLSGRKWPLPSVSIIQAGALTEDDAQVVLEAISAGKKEVNNDGLTFHPAERVIAVDPETPVQPLLRQAIDRLAAKTGARPALAVTCYVSDLRNGAELLNMVKTRFAGAAIDLIQPRRVAWQAEASCEGVSPGGGVRSPMIAFSGTQDAFGAGVTDVVLAAKRLSRALTEAGAPASGEGALVRFYVLTPEIAGVAREQLAEMAPRTVIPVTGVGPASAGMAMDAVAPVR